MQRLLLSTIMAALLLLAGWGCGKKGGTEGDAPYNTLVEAFSSGLISRYTPINVVFSVDVDKSKISDSELKRLVRIKPGISGSLSFINSRTLRFTPDQSFERNTDYEMSIDLSKWFDIKGASSVFKFNFSTLPLEIHAEQVSFAQGAGNAQGSSSEAWDGFYDITYLISTPDREDNEMVESLVAISEEVQKSWIHAQQGNQHRLTISVKADATKGRDISLSVAPNKLGLAEQSLASTHIPARNEFSVYSVKYIESPERCVEITFTQTINSKQNLEGLATIEGNSNNTVSVEGNQLRLYPDANCQGTRQVYVSSAITSKSGVRLLSGTASNDLVFTVEISPAKPGLEFTGEGNIIPLANELIVPFRAVHLRGVVVRVVKVQEKNVGQFLQTNSLEGSYALMQVGHLAARKTIFFDEKTNNLGRWNTYAIRLSDLINPEPGAIYRLILSSSPDLSNFSCDTLSEKPTKEAVLAADDAKFKAEAARFDRNHSEYYYFGNVFGDGGYYYYYDEEEEGVPEVCSEYYYYRLTKEKNILATNIGLAAKRGSGEEMIFLAHDLLTTNPQGAVNVEVFDYRHHSLGSTSTNAEGQARILLRDAQTQPFYAIASQGRQRAYLRIDPGSALSLSAFDVAGAVVQKGIKGFIYGDRGVWRPGDTLHIGFMLNDRSRTLPAAHPVSIELFTPQGQSYLRKTSTQGTLGLYAFNLPTDPDAPTGAWNIIVQVGGINFEKRIRIESIKPNRLKIQLDLPKLISRDKEATIPIHAEWLNGSIARNLKYDIQAMLTKAPTTFDGYSDYHFDDPGKSYETEELSPLEGTTDATGNASQKLNFDNGNSAPGMLTANFTTRVYEESGEFSIDAASIPYSPYPSYVGIKSPQSKDEPFLATGKDQTFRVVMLTEQGKPSASRLEVKVWKTRWYWWWDESHGEALANYINNSDMTLIRTSSVQTDSKGEGRFVVNIPEGEWGSYFISVKDPSGGHSTGALSYFDSPYYSGPARSSDGSDSPTRLSIRTDKDSYSPGEKIALSFPSPEGSRAIVSIENGSQVLSIREYPCTAGETTLNIDVTSDMEPNAYIYIMLLQPYRHEANDLPIRLYGVAPFKVSSAESQLSPLIQTVAEYKPEAPYSITVSEKTGRSMAYTLAIVDEGLLDLTRFRTPDPWQTFNAREAHGVSTWDLYNYILGAYGGRIQQIFGIGGSDALAKGPKAVVNRFKPVVRFEGPFLLGKGENKTHTYDMPNYNGRVRIMIVAGDGYAYGSSEKSVMVRKPVMLLGSLPRVIGTEEEMLIPTTVFATEDKVGTVRLSIACSNNMQVVGSASQEINMTTKGDQTVYFRVKTGNRPGAGKVTISATGKGEKSTYETDIELRSVARPQVKIESVSVEPGKSWNGKVALPGIDGTNSLSLEVSTLAPINLGWRLEGLLGYPHGCLEQITSKAFPQLYLKDFASLSSAQASSADIAVKATLNHYRSYFSNGELTYWPGTRYVNDWASIYALHFMTEAAAKGYAVPSGIKNAATSSVRKAARDWRGPSNTAAGSDELTQAYRLYVLSLEQQAEIGAMNRLRERSLANPAAKWLLSAAYALAGRKDVADELIGRTYEQTHQYNSYDHTFGSYVRDYGICLQTLVLLNKGQEAAQISRKIADQLSSSKYLSTQEVAFSLIGLSAYIKRYSSSGGLSFAYKYNGSKEVSVGKSLWTETLFSGGPSSAAVEISNSGKATIFVRLISEGIPARGEEKASANGVEISVVYVNGSGQEVKPESLKQGQDFTSVVTVKNPRMEPIQNLVVSQIFPAGWEILNTRFLEQEGAAANDNNISYQDIRDDRVYSYINSLGGNKNISFRVKLAAVYAGAFYLPPTYCEAMYNHLIQSNTTGINVVVEK